MDQRQRGGMRPVHADEPLFRIHQLGAEGVVCLRHRAGQLVCRPEPVEQRAYHTPDRRAQHQQRQLRCRQDVFDSPLYPRTDGGRDSPQFRHRRRPLPRQGAAGSTRAGGFRFAGVGRAFGHGAGRDVHLVVRLAGHENRIGLPRIFRRRHVRGRSLRSIWKGMRRRRAVHRDRARPRLDVSGDGRGHQRLWRRSHFDGVLRHGVFGRRPAVGRDRRGEARRLLRRRHGGSPRHRGGRGGVRRVSWRQHVGVRRFRLHQRSSRG